MRGQSDDWWGQRIECEGGDESYHVEYEQSELVSTTVVLSVAAIEGTDPTSLPPLATAIDPDALDSLFTDGVRGQFSFRYTGYEVTVHGDGRIDIVPEANDI